MGASPTSCAVSLGNIVQPLKYAGKITRLNPAAAIRSISASSRWGESSRVGASSQPRVCGSGCARAGSASNGIIVASEDIVDHHAARRRVKQEGMREMRNSNGGKERGNRKRNEVLRVEKKCT